MSTPPTSQSPSRNSPPPPDALRHMQSNSILISPTSPKDKSNRVSQLLSPSKTGSRSPTSIPSSPTSVHSSSSAIFERDIEPLSPLTHHPTNPHRIPRAKTTETLEQSVPSVLDSAAEILAGLPDSETATLDSVAVEAPAMFEGGRRSGFTSPIGSLRSRSPSPMGRTSLLLSIPPQSPQQATSQPQTGGLSPQRDRLAVSTATSGFPSAAATAGTNTPPSIITPTSAYFSTASSIESSPATTTREHAPPLPASPGTQGTTLPLSPATTIPTHPPSPTHAPTKRLSFMSYNDLLGGTPASTLPLSVLTSSVTAIEPPPHIPSVTGFSQQHPHSPLGGSAGVGGGGGSATASLKGFPLDPPRGNNRDSIVLLDEVGGEWEREGLGRGLEERLEGLMPPMAQKA